MNVKHKDLINSNLVELVQKIFLPGIFLRLKAKNVLNEEQISYIEYNRNEFQQKEKLMDVIIQRPEKDVITFCEVLQDTNQGHIVDDYFSSFFSKAKKAENRKQNDKHKSVADKEDDNDSGAESATEDEHCLILKDNLYMKTADKYEEHFSAGVIKKAKDKHEVYSAGMKMYGGILEDINSGCIERKFRFFHSSNLANVMKIHETVKKLTTELISPELKETIGDQNIIIVPRIKNEKQCAKMLEKMKQRERDLNCTASDGEEDSTHKIMKTRAMKKYKSMPSLIDMSKKNCGTRRATVQTPEPTPEQSIANQPDPNLSIEAVFQHYEDTISDLQAEILTLQKSSKMKDDVISEMRAEMKVLGAENRKQRHSTTLNADFKPINSELCTQA